MIHKVKQIKRVIIHIDCTITVASFVHKYLLVRSVAVQFRPDMMSQELLWRFGHSFQAGGGLSI